MILAIIERVEDVLNEKPFNNRYYLTEHYKEIFEQLDVLLFPVISEKNLEKVCEICDGLIVTGSRIDIQPKYYNEDIMQSGNYQVDEFRLDKKIIKLFAKNNKPILGICGGIQSINVVFGGTLNQIVPNHQLTDKMHKINILTGSFLHKIYNKNELEVNSYHNQAIKDIAPNFNISAISEDGIVEAIENKNIVGVQWHPEEMKDIEFFKNFLKIFF